jgi:hypothetical protein
MENKSSESMETPSMMTYVMGAVLVVAVVGGAWYFRSKGTKSTMVEQPPQQEAMVSPTPGPISALGCDQQYYNPRNGFPEYYLSVEGGDVSSAKKVTCEFTASVDGKVVSKTTVSSPLTDAPARGGATFRCTTKPLELAANVPTVVDVKLTDDLNANASCSATFTFQ